MIAIDYSPGEQLARVLAYYGLLESDSDVFKIICPFHGDVNPSMQIDLSEGKFYCFGCAAAGGAYEFVKLANPKLNDLESCIKLQKIIKSKKVRGIKFKKPNKRKRQDNQTDLNIAHDYYFGLKTVDWRTDSQEEVKSCYSYMKARGFSADTLNKVKAKVTYNQSYPIIFPLMDNGEFKGWDCRTMDKRVEKKRKYLYNEGFSRATTLVGSYGGSSNVVIVVEGYMDYLKMVQFGCKKVVALLGWRATTEQVQKLKGAGITNIVSALDNDDYGRKGTEFLKKFFKVTRFQFEDGFKDPGEMDKKSFDRMMRKTKMQFRIDNK